MGSRGHRGGGRGSFGVSQGQVDGKLRAHGTDRYCTSCGGTIKGMGAALLANCPLCSAAVRLALFGEDFHSSGWGRCRNCKSYIFREDVHCQNCRHINSVAKAAKDLLFRQTLAKRQHEMKKESEAKDAKIARQEAQIRELNAIVGQKEAASMFQVSGDIEDDGMDEIFSQTDTGEDAASKTGSPLGGRSKVASGESQETILKEHEGGRRALMGKIVDETKDSCNGQDIVGAENDDEVTVLSVTG